jgi:cytochrome oxidase Cu insertion factor (SCO1/SenC/PrrC family)
MVRQRIHRALNEASLVRGEAVALPDAFAAVDRLRASRDRDALVGLLAEQSPVYAGRGSGETERLRGYILASFETAGLPASALPFVIEELEIGLNPYPVAAAAKAVRGAHEPPERITALLLDAIDRTRTCDDVVCFDRGADPGKETSKRTAETTALMELFRTLAWLGPAAREAEAPLKAMLERRPAGFSAPVAAEIKAALAAVSAAGRPARAHCCGGSGAPVAFEPRAQTPIGFDIRVLQMEDQDGAVFSFGDFFLGRASVLTFFYTRCMNPTKCSLTITKLARLQQRLIAEGLQHRFGIAAVSYDPAFDRPARLRAYGEARGMAFDDRNKLLRTTGSFESLQRWLDLGVGFGSTTVNQHRLDIVVLDDRGKPATTISRVQWDEDDIVSALKAAHCSGNAAP